MTRSKPKRHKTGRANDEPHYPLQGSSLDIPLATALRMDDAQRRRYIKKVLSALHREIQQGTMALKTRVSVKKELRDLRHLLRAPADKYLYTDERNYKRNVLGKGAPGFTHTVWSRKFTWQMATKQGNLAQEIAEQHLSLVRKLDALLDGKNAGKRKLRITTKTAIQNILSFLQFDKGVNAAFPPFHAKFLADTFLPKEGDCLVVDPCAGWGGRLLGTLCVNRTATVRYLGVDPERRNKEAYENLLKRVQVYLKAEMKGPREAEFSYRPFEDWITSPNAKSLKGKVDLVLTSPPYFGAENYNTKNAQQSANRYKTYEEWRERFYRKLVKGAFDLLKPGGVFVLNIADVTSAKQLEKDARILAREAGFENAGFYKLAMSVTPGTRGNERHRVVVDGVTFKNEPVFCFVKPAGNDVVSRSLPIKQQPQSVQKVSDDNLLGDWTDPNPAPVIEEHSAFLVVRDDLLGVGSKVRFLDYLVKSAPEKEFVFGASNKVGYGAISLSYLCRKYRKKAVFFMAKTNNPTWHQKRVLELGGIIHFVPNGMLAVTNARAREYAAKDPRNRRFLPMGFEDQTVLASIVKVARSLKYKSKPVVPKEIWSVGSSGTLSRGLQAAFPKARVNVVQTGHAMTKAQIGKAILHKAPYKYDRKCKEAEMPDYNSEPYYDAKVWSFVKKYGKKGALIWNVA